MFLNQVFFAAIVACAAPVGGEAECREFIVGAYTDERSCVDATAEIGSLIAFLADPALPAYVGAQCVAVPLSEA